LFFQIIDFRFCLIEYVVRPCTSIIYSFFISFSMYTSF
jgi:hypothetical protein